MKNDKKSTSKVFRHHFFNSFINFIQKFRMKTMKFVIRLWKLMSLVTSETQKCKNEGFGSHQ